MKEISRYIPLFYYLNNKKTNKTLTSIVASEPKMIAVNCYGCPKKQSPKMMKRQFFYKCLN